MNTATATHRFQTISALSIALLISGTTSASHRSDSSNTPPHSYGYEDVDVGKGIQSCKNSVGAVVSNLGTRQVRPPCGGPSSTTDAPSPIRLAKPLSGRPYLRSIESIRYSF